MKNLEENIDAIDKEVANRIYRARSILGMSRVSLAKAVGVSHQQVAKYESGDNRVTTGRLVAIAKKLQKPLEYFYTNLLEDGAGS